MRFTYILVVVLAIVVAAGLVLTFRLEPTPDLSTVPDGPAPSPIDNTTPFPPPSEKGDLADLTPIDAVVDVRLVTSFGDVDLQLDGTAAPDTVGNFVFLANSDFYDGTSFHRVIPGFMIQGGDPLSRDQSLRARHGTGGPNYTFPDEINPNKIVRGTIAMANSGPDTNGSQFFIVTADEVPHLDGVHTYFGKVTSGMEVVDSISRVDTDANDNPLTPVIIQDVVVGDISSVSDALQPLE